MSLLSSLFDAFFGSGKPDSDNSPHDYFHGMTQEEKGAQAAWERKKINQSAWEREAREDRDREDWLSRDPLTGRLDEGERY